MAQVHIRPTPTVPEQMRQMQLDALYDVADTAASDRQSIPDPSLLADIAASPAPPKVPKVFLSNDCVFNCAYCGCRCSNGDRQRYCHDPKDLARLAVASAKECGQGVFVTSSICRNADYTQERIVAAIRCMREELHYTGYIHAKVMPGTDPGLIRETGRYADRLSVNIEVAKSDGYARIARQKNRDNILTPMRQICSAIRDAAQYPGRRFATSQTTQLMAGSTDESDRTILTLSQALYRQYRLKRVYYTAFQYRQPAAGYDLPLTATPVWRMRRLYQADRLMMLYGFAPEEIAPEEAPFLSADVDPKLAWAIRHIDRFPVEVNTADYEMLLRVPGIGQVYAQRILRTRRQCTITHDVLGRLGVPFKRYRYFLQCNGRYLGGDACSRPDRLYALLGTPETPVYEQLTF